MESMTPNSATKAYEEVYRENEIEAMSAEDLLAAYKRTGRDDLKWALVLRYEGLIRTIALRVRGIYSSFAQTEDIINEGVIALLSSVDKFDPEKGVKFETFAAKRIRGMVIDLARRQDWLPRGVRKQAREIDIATNELYGELGRFPTDTEVAERMGITTEKYQEDLSRTALCNMLSLEALLEEKEHGGALTGGLPSDYTLSEPERALQEEEFQSILTEAISELRDNEQMVLALYYTENLNMKEIATVMNVSEPRISQLHSRAIQKLRIKLERYMRSEL